MRFFRRSLCAFGFLGALLAQAPPTGPVVPQRGIINPVTQQPAPSTVAPGGIVWISGLNLGPPEGLKASGFPLPTRLGDPPLEVLVNGVAAPLFSATPGRIVAQVPWETAQGIARVVVRRGDSQSRPARVFISQIFPAVRARGDKGYGEVDGSLSGTMLTVMATGLGPTQPAVASGEAGPQDPPAAPRGAMRAYVDGLPARVTAALSTTRVGEFEVKIEVPPQAQPGDVLTVIAGNRAANRVTYSKAGTPEVSFVRMPGGAPQLRALVGSDLRGTYLIANGGPNEQGCYPSFLFDLARRRVSRLEACLITGNRNAPSPVAAPVDSPVLAAFVGPAEGELPAGISSKVEIYHPARAEALTVELPAPAATLAGGAGENLLAAAPGDPPRAFNINVQNGRVTEAEAGPNPGAAAGGVAGVLRNLQLDLGDGLKHILAAPAALGPDLFVTVIGNDANQPTAARLAVLNPRGEVAGTQEFPAGWAPLVAPPPSPQQPAAATPAPTEPGGGTQPQPGAGGGAGAGQGSQPGAGAGGQTPQPGAGAQTPPASEPQPQAPVPAAQAFRVTARVDQESGTYFVLSRKTDGSAHGMVVFSADASEPQAVSFPAGWYAASCTANIRLLTLELSHRFAMFGSSSAETEVKNPCPAQGFLVFNPDSRTVAALPLLGQGQINASGAAGDVNDYVFATNTDPSRRNIAETLFVLDGVASSVLRLDLPPSVVGFSGLTPIPAIGALVGLATNRAAGDMGLILFDLESETTRLLPTPEGFASVSLVGFFNATRKLVARGIKANNAGSQYLIYDLVTGDLLMPANPEGVVWVGTAPRPAGQTQAIPLLEDINPKANFISAVAYDEQRRPIGVMSIRIP